MRKATFGLAAALLMGAAACEEPTSAGEELTGSAKIGQGDDPFAGLTPNLHKGLKGMDEQVKSLSTDRTLMTDVSSYPVQAPDAWGNTWVRSTYRVRTIPNRVFLTDVWFFPHGGYEAVYKVTNDGGHYVTYFRESAHNPSAPSDPWADESGMNELAAFGLSRSQLEHLAAARSALWQNETFLNASSSTFLFNMVAASADDKVSTCKKICVAAAVAAGFAAGLITGAACELAATAIAGPPGAVAAGKACGAAGGVVGAASGAAVGVKCNEGCDKLKQQQTSK